MGARTSRLVIESIEHQARITAAAFSPDGTRVVGNLPVNGRTSAVYSETRLVETGALVSVSGHS